MSENRNSFDLNRKLKLSKDASKIYRTTRTGNLMLKEEEVQRRLDLYYGGKLKVVEYNGVAYKGKLHCKKCGTFETKKSMGSYVRLGVVREDCELCYYKEKLENYNHILNSNCLEVKDWYTLNHETLVVISCKICGDNKIRQASLLNVIVVCKNCEHISLTKEYMEILKKHNCTYIDRFYEKESKTVYIKSTCNICGTLNKTNGNTFYKNETICRTCHPQIYVKSYNEAKNNAIERARNNGKVLLKYESYCKLNLLHLFCGNDADINRAFKLDQPSHRCCMYKLNMGTRKEHNYHLVEEYLRILENVKLFKDFLTKHNQLDNIPPGKYKTILEYIEGWIYNYKYVVNNYPEGDVGTVLENNSLYTECKEFFYPLMKRFNLKIK